VVVSNEAELKAAVNNAPSGVSVVIVFDRDITITHPFDISESKNIRLISEAMGANFRLVGFFNGTTLSVMNGGLLCLDGISVTHENGFAGSGVYVGRDSALLMYSGKISDNKVTGDGGGVYNTALLLCLVAQLSIT
jgi:hypothetical protein